VESVNNNGTVNVVEANWAGSGIVGRRTVDTSKIAGYYIPDQKPNGNIAYSTGKEPITLASADTINLGSSLAQKNNNPGNLRFAGQEGASQGSGGFARFDTPEAGYNALQKQIDLDKSRDLTVQEFVSKYAPPSENNTGQYIQQFNDNLGTDNGTKLSQLDTKEVARFMAMKESSTQIGEKIASSNIKLNTKEESVVKAVASGKMTTEEAKDTITTAFKEKVSNDPATTATVEKLALVPPVVPYSNIGYIPPEKMYDTFSIYGFIASLKLLQQQPSYFKTPDLTQII
jgi:surface antigen